MALVGQITLVINSKDTASDLDSYIRPRTGLQAENMNGISDLIGAMNGGMKDIQDATLVIGIPAVGKYTFAGQPSNDETCVINGVTFTAKTSGATGDQFNIGSTLYVTATNLAAAINASTTAGIVSNVTAATGDSPLTHVVNVSALVTGKYGLGYTIADSLTNVSTTAFALATAETSRTSF
jgi:hypothetical protein